MRFITSLCRVTVSSKFSTFLSSTVECNGSASLSFFACLLSLNRQIEGGVRTESPETHHRILEAKL